MYDVLEDELIEFPSPCGVKVVANNDMSVLTPAELLNVSVPLRGKGCG